MSTVISPASGAPAAGGPQQQKGPPPYRLRWFALAVLCFSLLVVSLDNTILNVALPTLVRDLHASTSELQWVVDAYATVFAGLLLVLGSLGDRVGRKWVFMAGLGVFAAGSATSAFSATTHHLIAARAFMGVGAAAIMPSTLSLLSNIFTDDAERARAIGIWSGTTGLGIAVGPIVGGWLLAHAWWGSVFLVNVPICALGLLAAIWLVPNSRDAAAKAPDPLGAVLSTVGLGTLLWGIIEAPTRGWSSPWVVGAIGAAAVLLAGFVTWERRCSHPMLDVDVFRSRRFSVAMASMATTIFALMGMLFLLTQYLQFSLGYSALETGVRVLPVAAVLIVVAPASTLLVRRLGTKVVVATGMGVIAVGLVLLSRTTVAGSYGDALPALLMLGIGTGLAFAPSIESIIGSLPRHRAGVGSATNGAALQVGGALGVAVLGSLLDSRYRHMVAPHLAHQAMPASVAQLITGSLGGALAIAVRVGGRLGAELAVIARHAFVSGMGLAVVVAAVAVTAAASVVLALLPSRPDGWVWRDTAATAPGDTTGPASPVRRDVGPWCPGVGLAEHGPMTTRVFLLDDHEIVRRGLKELLEADDDLLVVGEASTAEEALRRVPATRPDVAVLDVHLPDGDGIEVCRELRTVNPDLRCLMLTAFGGDEALYSAILAGASGFVLKQINGSNLVDAVRRVAAGESLIDPSLSAKFLERIRREQEEEERINSLTGQERRILELLADGKTNRQIAAELYLAEKTVKNYVSDLLAKLGFSRRTEAAVYAVRLSERTRTH